MIKKFFTILLISSTLITNSFSAGSSGSSEGDGPKKTNYDKAVSFVNSGKLYSV